MNDSVPAIDVWAQPADPLAFQRIPEIARLFRQSGSATLIENGLSTQDIVAMMDRGNVERMLLCAWCRPGTWIYSNDDIASVVRDYPDRFVGVASVDLEKPVQAVHELGEQQQRDEQHRRALHQAHVQRQDGRCSGFRQRGHVDQASSAASRSSRRHKCS